MSNEPNLCVLTGAYCTTKDCPLYRDHKCDFIKAIQSILATFAPAKAPAPERRESHPLIPKTLKPFPKLEPGKYLQEITGEVVDDVTVKEVETRRGPVMIANFNLTDGEARIRVALWEDLVSEAEKFRPGDVITLKGMCA